MPAALFDVEPLLAPLDGPAPCGPELDIADPEFHQLERASTGKPEVQIGEKVYPAEDPDWPRVFELSLSLLARTRDLRLAVWLARSGARLLGLPGAARGLQLVHGLLERQWPQVHPQLDADDNDPTMRMNALAALAAPDALLADLRAAALASVRGSLTLRELELGLGRAKPHGNEPQPTEAGVLQALQTLTAAHPETVAAVREAAAAAEAIARLLESNVRLAAPDLAPLREVLGVATGALARLQPSGGPVAPPATDPSKTPSPAAPGSGADIVGGGSIRTRADAARELGRLCEWFERHEPAHPAPLLMRRAQRLMGMSFIEIIQDVAPGGYDQVQGLVGPRPE